MFFEHFHCMGSFILQKSLLIIPAELFLRLDDRYKAQDWRLNDPLKSLILFSVLFLFITQLIFAFLCMCGGRWSSLKCAYCSRGALQ